MQLQELVPTMITSNTLISVGAKGHRPELASRGLQEMRQRCAMFDVITYKALIGALDRGKQPKQALEAFQALQ